VKNLSDRGKKWLVVNKPVKVNNEMRIVTVPWERMILSRYFQYPNQQ
jgi:hypothetical protein